MVPSMWGEGVGREMTLMWFRVVLLLRHLFMGFIASDVLGGLLPAMPSSSEESGHTQWSYFSHRTGNPETAKAAEHLTFAILG